MSPSGMQIALGVLNGLVNVYSGGGLSPVMGGLGGGSGQVMINNAGQLSNVLGQMGGLNQQIGTTVNGLPAVWGGQAQQAGLGQFMIFQDCFGQGRQVAQQIPTVLNQAGTGYQNQVLDMTRYVAGQNVAVAAAAAVPIGGQAAAAAVANTSSLSTLAKLGVLSRFLRAGGQTLLGLRELMGKTSANDNWYQAGRGFDGLGDMLGVGVRTVVPAFQNLFGGAPPAPAPTPTPPPKPTVPVVPTDPRIIAGLPGAVPGVVGYANPTVTDPNVAAYASQYAAAYQPSPQVPTVYGSGVNGWVEQTPGAATGTAAVPAAADVATAAGNSGNTVTIRAVDTDGNGEADSIEVNTPNNKDMKIDVAMTIGGKELKGHFDIDAAEG